MSVNLSTLGSIAGFVGAAIVDSSSGMLMGSEGGGQVNLEVAAAGNTEVVNAKRRVANALNLNDKVEDILITLGKQYHLIRPLSKHESVFLYLILDRARANLAMARYELREFEAKLAF